MNKSLSLFIACACAIAVIPRIVPLPVAYNLSALGALALVSGAVVRPRWLALTLPLGCRLLTDCWIEAKTGFGFYNGMVFDYTAYAMIFAVGTLLAGQSLLNRKKSSVAKNALTGLLAGLGSGAIFFIVSNLGVWLLAPEHSYTRDLSGLIKCYVAAIPFAKGTFIGDLLYSGVFFGIIGMLPVSSTDTSTATETSTTCKTSLASTSGD